MNLFKKFRIKNYLRIGFVIIFLSAGIYRIFFFHHAVEEAHILGLNKGFEYFIISFEIIISILFILNKFMKEAIIALIVFLSIAILYGIIRDFNYIYKNLYNIFIFTPEPDDILLHIIYIGGLIIFYFKVNDKYENKKNS